MALMLSKVASDVDVGRRPEACVLSDSDRRVVARATYAGLEELERLASLAGQSDDESMVEALSRLPGEQRLVALTLCDALDYSLRALGVV